jgi:uncharacterized membrane protein
MIADRSALIVRTTSPPLYATLVPVSVAYFAGALLSDIAYARTANMMWADFSAWMLAAGLAFSALATVCAIVDYFVHRQTRPTAASWIHIVGSLIVVGLAVLDNFIHSRDAWTSVVPSGLILSAFLLAASLITAWAGSFLVFRRRGIAE